ncbi:MAG: ABC transporter substrate-binding protein [Acidobacteria bacterium]|nr:ABC transporter substrate-binding protein [Acidobacteriota bacterium]
MASRVLQRIASALCLALTACRAPAPPPNTLTFLIESSPNNLDLRQGTDAQSERIGDLIYDPLVRKDAHFNLQPWLAASWQQPNPLTWIFHLRPNVRFHDNHPLSSADVAWSIRSMSNGTLISPKAGAFASITAIDTPDPLTLILHTRTPDPSLLFNLSDGLFGVVESGANRSEGLHPIGTGPFRFVSQVQDKDVILDRNPTYWAGPASPTLQHLIFEVVPDTITAALEMKKGSADVESNLLTMDMVHALRNQPNLRTTAGPGARVDYLNINTQDPALRDPRVRQAIAFAIDKPALIASIWRGQAQPADTLLPPGHWAAAPSASLAHYPHSTARAIQLLDAAGLHPDHNGIRLRLTMKTSTDETTRLEAQAMQAELRDAGIDLTLRSTEFGTFYADITKGAFQLYLLRWIGSNEDPDIFHYAYATSMFPPRGANRGRYSNPHLDTLLQSASAATDQPTRRNDYIQIQQILSQDLPSIPLWYPNNIVIHTTRLTHVISDPGGSFDFLRTAVLQ